MQTWILVRGSFSLVSLHAEYGLVAPPAPPQACYSMAVYCVDVDALLNRAVAAGATIREPLTTFVTGDRFASIIDPHGVSWSLMSRVQDLSEDECKQNVVAWAKEQTKAYEE
ncbi:VOC family protein [Glutamicibacter ardleyensis]|uniref:VOC family protein n=1 Tax=Glutamicibacter ardleyensis TaxID=225894 RepID=UPI003F994932